MHEYVLKSTLNPVFSLLHHDENIQPNYEKSKLKTNLYGHFHTQNQKKKKK